MFGRLIIALLMIGAAAVVTMERETAVVADMSADLAESKYSDAEERAKRWEARAVTAEAKLADLEIKNKWLEGEAAEATRLRELALLPLEVKIADPSMNGELSVQDLMRVAAQNAVGTNACFARAPTRGPEVKMRWFVRPDGRATTIAPLDTPEGYADVVVCLANEIAGWRFPTSAGLTVTHLTWRTMALKPAVAPTFNP